MTQSKHEVAPVRSDKHQALAVFLGRWRADGESYGGPKQRVETPKSAAEPWVSTHSGGWHTGEFVLIQDERAAIAGTSFDTLSVMGVDAKTGRHFARTFGNHGFYRHYDMDVEAAINNPCV